MPRDGAIIFSDLIGKLDVLRVTCNRCGRNGRYRLQSLIAERGGDESVPDWLAELTADCSIKQAQNWNDRCAAHRL
jgi:hypothetical protein